MSPNSQTLHVEAKPAPEIAADWQPSQAKPRTIAQSPSACSSTAIISLWPSGLSRWSSTIVAPRDSPFQLCVGRAVTNNQTQSINQQNLCLDSEDIFQHFEEENLMARLQNPPI